MIVPGTLDPSPVPPPRLARSPQGRPLDFATVVAEAGMPDVVSTHSPPSIRVHGGEHDFKVPHAAGATYCIGGATLPRDPVARAREVMRRLAYGFLDWAARETVARYHRDLRRAAIQPSGRTERKGELPVTVRIRRLIRSSPGLSVGAIAARTGLAQPNVSRALGIMVRKGEVTVERRGSESAWYAPEPATEETPSPSLGM